MEQSTVGFESRKNKLLMLQYKIVIEKGWLRVKIYDSGQIKATGVTGQIEDWKCEYEKNQQNEWVRVDNRDSRVCTRGMYVHKG